MEEDNDVQGAQAESNACVIGEHEGVDQEPQSPAALGEISTAASPGFQVHDGSVIVTPSKAFQSDSSESESDGNITDDETDYSDAEDCTETKYVLLFLVNGIVC